MMKAPHSASIASALFAVSLAVAACGGSDAEPAAGGCPEAIPSNPAECPAEYPGTGGSCSPGAIKCRYHGPVTAKDDGCASTRGVTCLAEGNDSGAPIGHAWWPLYN